MNLTLIKQVIKKDKLVNNVVSNIIILLRVIMFSRKLFIFD